MKSATPAPLTVRQGEILRHIRACIRGGLPPTVRELMAQFDIASQNGVECHLRALERKGYLVRSGNKSRGIRLVGDPDPDEFLRQALASLRRAVLDHCTSEQINGPLAVSLLEAHLVSEGYGSGEVS